MSSISEISEKLTFIINWINSVNEKSKKTEEFDEQATLIPTSKIRVSNNGSPQWIELSKILNNSRIYIEGNPFTYIPLPTNTTNGFVTGDIAVNGWMDDTKFIKTLSYNSGDPELFSSWEIIESI